LLHGVYFATAKPRLEDPDADLPGSSEKAVTALACDFIQRRVDRVKSFLVALGFPEGNIQTEAFGEQKNLTDKQVRAAVERNPELSPEDRQKALDNTRKIILASNRRAEITPSNAGQAWQNSVREFPFNAADSLTLLQEEALGKRRSRANGKAKPKTQPYSRGSWSMVAHGMRKNNKAGLVGPAFHIWN